MDSLIPAGAKYTVIDGEDFDFTKLNIKDHIPNTRLFKVYMIAHYGK